MKDNLRGHGKRLALIAAVLIFVLLAFAGCRGQKPKHPGYRASETYFLHDNWILYLYFNNNAVHFNAKEQIVETGSWTSEGSKVVLSMPGSSLDGKKLVYDGSDLHLGDQVYQHTLVTGLFKSEQTGKTMNVSSLGFLYFYTDYENRAGKDVGQWKLDGGSFVFESPLLGPEPVLAVYEKGCWIIDGIPYEHIVGKISLDVPKSMIFGAWKQEEQMLIFNELLSKLGKYGFETQEDLTAILQPGEASGDLRFTVNGAEAIIRCVNNNPQPAPMSECMLFSFYTEDTTGVFAVTDLGHRCGEATFDEMLQPDCTDYDADHGAIVYESFTMTAIRLNDAERIPESDTIIELKFVNEILKSFRIYLPSAERAG